MTPNEIFPELTAEDFSAYPILVVHFWAVWDKLDFELAENLAVVSKWYPQVGFRTVNTDLPERWPQLNEWKLLNLPSLGFFENGVKKEIIIGLRSQDQIEDLFSKWGIRK